MHQYDALVISKWLLSISNVYLNLTVIFFQMYFKECQSQKCQNIFVVFVDIDMDKNLLCIFLNL